MHWVACFFSKSAYFHALLVAQSSARLAIKHFSHKVSPPKILPTSGESCSLCQQEKSSTYMCMCVFTLGRQLSMRHRFFFFWSEERKKKKKFVIMLRLFLLYLTLTLFFCPFSCRIEQREGLYVTIKQRVLFCCCCFFVCSLILLSILKAHYFLSEDEPALCHCKSPIALFFILRYHAKIIAQK